MSHCCGQAELIQRRSRALPFRRWPDRHNHRLIHRRRQLGLCDPAFCGASALGYAPRRQGWSAACGPDTPADRVAERPSRRLDEGPAGSARVGGHRHLDHQPGCSSARLACRERFRHRAGRAVRANIVAAATHQTDSGTWVGLVRRTRSACARRVRHRLAALPPSTSVAGSSSMRSSRMQERLPPRSGCLLGRLRINRTLRCPAPTQRGHPAWHGLVLHPAPGAGGRTHRRVPEHRDKVTSVPSAGMSSILKYNAPDHPRCACALMTQPINGVARGRNDGPGAGQQRNFAGLSVSLAGRNQFHDRITGMDAELDGNGAERHQPGAADWPPAMQPSRRPQDRWQQLITSHTPGRTFSQSSRYPRHTRSCSRAVPEIHGGIKTMRISMSYSSRASADCQPGDIVMTWPRAAPHDRSLVVPSTMQTVILGCTLMREDQHEFTVTARRKASNTC